MRISIRMAATRVNGLKMDVICYSIRKEERKMYIVVTVHILQQDKEGIIE